jgi:cell division transport system permease protein
VSPRFFLVEAVRSLRANISISVAATVTVLITGFILGAFIASFLYVQSTVDAQKERLDIRAYIADSARADQVNSLANELAGMQRRGLVDEVEYLTKDQALAEFRERLDNENLLDQLPGNPIPANFIIKPSDPERSDEIISALADHPAVDEQLGVKDGGPVADRFLSIARFIQWAGLGLVSILLVASVLLIGNTIRLSLFARRREVEVMKLVGATNWFIRWPFVIEGVICGVVGALASVALLFAVKLGVVDQFLDRGDQLTRNEAEGISFVALSLILVAAGALVGALGSGVTLRRFLRV